MNRVIVSFFALLAAAPLAAQEQTPRVLSLDEALEITLSGSPVIEASRYEEKAAQQERRAAIGLRMPANQRRRSLHLFGQGHRIRLQRFERACRKHHPRHSRQRADPDRIDPPDSATSHPGHGSGLVPDIAGPQSRIRRRAGNPADLYGRQDQHGQPCRENQRKDCSRAGKPKPQRAGFGARGAILRSGAGPTGRRSTPAGSGWSRPTSEGCRSPSNRTV